MRLLRRLGVLAGVGIPLDALGSPGSAGIDAYDLVDQLPRGPARVAAWCAYALQIYGDKLSAASEAAGSAQAETVEVVQSCYALVEACLAHARAPEPHVRVDLELPEWLPHWRTPVRTQEQLAGMRGALESLRTYVAFDLGRLAADSAGAAAMQEGLAGVDAKLEIVARLWAPRAPVELRGGIGDALTIGLDRAYAVGRALADPERSARVASTPADS